MDATIDCPSHCRSNVRETSQPQRIKRKKKSKQKDKDVVSKPSYKQAEDEVDGNGNI